MFVHLNFRGHEARVTGGVVRRALERISGPEKLSENLRSVCLANCRRISGPQAEGILDRLAATCPKVEQMDVTGCTLEVVIRAFAVRTRHALCAASPLELYESISTLQMEGGDRMQFEDLRLGLTELPGPHVVLEGGLQDMVDAGALQRILLTEARQGSGWAMALLLGLKFHDIQCTHDTVDQESGSNLIHLQGKDNQGSTPLLLACRMGNLELAQVLVETGAEVSATLRCWLR
jgi:hypothetical protein